MTLPKSRFALALLLSAGLLVSAAARAQTTAAAPVPIANYAGWKAAVAQSESGGNLAANNGLGYVGQYQMGQSALETAGFVTPGVGTANDPSSWQWTSTAAQYGVTDINSFYASNAGQNAAMDTYTASNWQALQNNGATSYIGQTVNGEVLDAGGLLGAAHLAGAGGTDQWLNSGGTYDPGDANGTTPAIYAAKFNGYSGGTVGAVTVPNSPYATSAGAGGVNTICPTAVTNAWQQLSYAHVQQTTQYALVNMTKPPAVANMTCFQQILGNTQALSILFDPQSAINGILGLIKQAVCMAAQQEYTKLVGNNLNMSSVFGSITPITSMIPGLSIGTTTLAANGGSPFKATLGNTNNLTTPATLLDVFR